MKTARFDHVEAKMDDNMIWHSSIPQLADYLTLMSERRREEISPASGDPLSVVFSDVAKEAGATELMDPDLGEMEEPKGRIY